MYESSDTIVVCRPDQVKEAAVVISCCPAGQFTPLIVLEPPPVSEQEYRDLYEAYREVRNRRDELRGATIARRQTPVDCALNSEVDARTERLTPYRSWTKHNQLISRWLSKVSPRRVVFLFETERDDLRLIEPVPRDHISDSRFAVIPEEAQWVYLLPAKGSPGSSPGARHYYPHISRLAELSWEALRGSPFPEGAVEISADDLGGYFTGLYKSLGTSAPLRPVAASVGPPDWSATVPPGASEAVVIEISNHAAKLLGVVYAHFHCAKPVFYAEPDLGPIEGARTAMERKQEESAQAFRYVAAHRESGLQLIGLSEAETAALKLVAPVVEVDTAPFEPKRFLDALARLFGKEDMGPYIRRLEEAVSEAVPDAVVTEVGDLDMTAFTAGTPYNFVRKNGADWSCKTIGHIAGDSSLLILEDLLPTHEEADVGFNLIFDPGYFSTSETRDVLTELQRRVSYSLVLSGLAGTHLSLIHLSVTLPVELVFFNTHGSDNAILLRDMLLPAYKLVQRVTFPSRPIVFNNSCLSWVGVGREVIRSGARAYVGTLWSVDAREAAELARTAIRRMTQENTPAARAIRETGVGPVTERAYIFVGPAPVRLAAAPSTSDRKQLVSATRFLFLSAGGWLKEAGGDLQAPYIGPLVAILMREAEWIAEELDRRWPEPGLDRLDLYILQLGLLAQLPLSDHATQQKVADLVRHVEGMLDLPSVDERTKAQRRAQFLQYLSRVYTRTGQFLLAAQCLNASIEAAEKTGDSPGPQYLELSDALKVLGRNAEALAAAQRAREAFAAPPGKEFKDGPMGALGRLAQISIRLGHYDSALQCARDGFTEAVSRDSLREQCSFKGDETRALLRLDRTDEALVAANEYLSLARRAHDDLLEISAYGTVADVLMQRKEWGQALEKINAGLAQARAKGIVDEVGDFLRDLARVKSETGDGLGALACLREAGSIYVQTGRLANLKAVLETASHLSGTLRTWSAHAEMLRLETSIIDSLDESIRREICKDAVRMLKEAIREAGIAASRKPLRELRKEISGFVDRRGTNVSPQMVFVNRALGMFDDWASGRTTKARKEAAALDAMSAGGFELVDFLGRSAAAG